MSVFRAESSQWIFFLKILLCLCRPVLKFPMEFVIILLLFYVLVLLATKHVGS